MFVPQFPYYFRVVSEVVLVSHDDHARGRMQGVYFRFPVGGDVLECFRFDDGEADYEDIGSWVGKTLQEVTLELEVKGYELLQALQELLAGGTNFVPLCTGGTNERGGNSACGGGGTVASRFFFTNESIDLWQRNMNSEENYSIIDGNTV